MGLFAWPVCIVCHYEQRLALNNHTKQQLLEWIGIPLQVLCTQHIPNEYTIIPPKIKKHIFNKSI